MSTLILSQKIVSMTESFVVKKDGVKKYQAKRKLLSVGSDYQVFMDNKVIATIDEKVTNIAKNFDIYINGMYYGNVQKELLSITKDLQYDNRGWKIDGDLLGMNFKVIDSNNNIYATIKKKVIALSDVYEINVHNDNDELIMVILTIIIDEVFHSKRTKKD